MIEKPIEIEIQIGDIHWGVKSNDPTRNQDIKDFFHKFLIPTIKKTLEKYQGKNIVLTFLGDWTDNKSNIKTEISSYYTDLFFELSELVPIILICGNHDTPTKDNPEVNTVKAFKYFPNVKLVDSPFESRTVKGDTLLYIPYYHDKQIIKDIIKDKNGYLRMHGSIAGFHYNGIPINDVNNLSISDFANFKKVDSGHIHKPDLIENCEYLGSPYQIHEYEYRNTKLGVKVIDFEQEVEYFIENNISPKFLRLSFSEVMNMTMEQAEERMKNRYVSIFVPNSIYLKINIKETTEILSKFGKSINLVESEDIEMETKYIDFINGEEIEFKNIDIKSKFDDYVKDIETLPVLGVILDIDKDTKSKLIDRITNDYELCSKNIVEEEIEL